MGKSVRTVIEDVDRKLAHVERTKESPDCKGNFIEGVLGL